MSVIIILVIIGVIVAGIFLIGFIWAVKSGQYDDMYSPSVRFLFDDNNDITEENDTVLTNNDSENLETK